MLWPPFCFYHSKTGHICPVFECFGRNFVSTIRKLDEFARFSNAYSYSKTRTENARFSNVSGIRMSGFRMSGFRMSGFQIPTKLNGFIIKKTFPFMYEM
jgi:hypothetical protein